MSGDAEKSKIKKDPFSGIYGNDPGSSQESINTLKFTLAGIQGLLTGVKYAGVQIAGENDPLYFKGVPKTDEEWQRYVGTIDYYKQQYQNKDSAFCNLYVAEQAGQQGIYLPAM